jgi:hypothetical protein
MLKSNFSEGQYRKTFSTNSASCAVFKEKLFFLGVLIKSRHLVFPFWQRRQLESLGGIIGA